MDRIRQGVRSAAKISSAIALSIAAFIILTGRWVVKLFITGEAEVVESVVAVAYPYLIVMSVMLLVLYMLFIFRSALQGMGDTVIPMISGIVELVMRMSMALLLPLLLKEYGVYLAEVSAWLGAAVLLAVAYAKKMQRYQTQEKEKA